jgi:hypothetical protein
MNLTLQNLAEKAWHDPMVARVERRLELMHVPPPSRRQPGRQDAGPPKAAPGGNAITPRCSKLKTVHFTQLTVTACRRSSTCASTRKWCGKVIERLRGRFRAALGIASLGWIA